MLWPATFRRREQNASSAAKVSEAKTLDATVPATDSVYG
jgi:hypothetical protein